MPRPGLDDPDYRRFAWGRFRRLMTWMVGASLVAVIVSLAGLWILNGSLPLHMAIATALGVFFSVLLAAVLMGLVFLSSGTGHDETIRDPFADDDL